MLGFPECAPTLGTPASTDSFPCPTPLMEQSHAGVEGGEGAGFPLQPFLAFPQVEVVFWLLSMLATRDQEDTARTLLAMSSSPESCVAMRRSGCLPLLLQILHGAEAGAGGRAGNPGAPGAKDARMRANAALHNIVFSQPDQGLARKEMRVLHVLEQIRAYCETCWDWLQVRDGGPEAGGGECGLSGRRHPGLGHRDCAAFQSEPD